MSFLLVVIPIAHNYILYNRTSIIWASMIILKILPCSKRMLCSFIQTVYIFWTLLFKTFFFFFWKFLFKTLNHKVQVFKCSHSFLDRKNYFQSNYTDRCPFLIKPTIPESKCGYLMHTISLWLTPLKYLHKFSFLVWLWTDFHKIFKTVSVRRILSEILYYLTNL